MKQSENHVVVEFLIRNFVEKTQSDVKEREKQNTKYYQHHREIMNVLTSFSLPQHNYIA
jgi:hypothetical protein